MKLISLNVEGSRHWPLIDPFFDLARPDVICLQEVFEEDAARAAGRLGMAHAFSPMTLRHYDFSDENTPLRPFGIAILSRDPLRDVREQKYHSTARPISAGDAATLEARRATFRQTLLSAEVTAGDEALRVATTHFTWTPDGMSNRYQEEDARALMRMLDDMPPLALCGDFNIPRHVNPLYDVFIAKYRDAIPDSYLSSLDLSLHRRGGNPEAAASLAKFMVDYLFLGEGYRADDVRLQSGVSDHYAIVATVARDTPQGGR